ncbi:hypothetical protein WN51_10872 [Melipona quadrifasciata]|uniref:Uncharacterized protein n=1 Tax=Melipona quadrifasciata TaxID=166423 RepID=A0A0M9A658_9HYME|nr:hypothetical protein WN51_10872 [Melipona quadrifasciata]
MHLVEDRVREGASTTRQLENSTKECLAERKFSGGGYSVFNLPGPASKGKSCLLVEQTRNVSNVTTAIFFENIRRYCSDVQRFLSTASSPNFGRIEDGATDVEKQQPRNEKAEGKAGGMVEYSSRTELQWPVAWMSKRTLI